MMSGRALVGWVLALAVGFAGTGCSTSHQLPPQRQPSPVTRLAGGSPRHVAVVVMENEEFGDVIKSGATPFIDHLAATGALAEQMFAITHPSLPNYIALISGSTHRITDDCTDCTVAGAALPGQLGAHGIGWKAYMEDLPHRCFGGAFAGGYARKHDPFIVFDGVRQNAALCQRVVPLSQLAKDERTGRLPPFTWITPNLCHDMHDCDLHTGDRFLASLVPPLLRALGPRGLLILTWDEGSSDDGCCRLAHGGHIVTVLAGALAQPGARLATPVDHYSVLQTIEDLYGLPRLANAACACTPSLAPLLRAHRSRLRG